MDTQQYIITVLITFQVVLLSMIHRRLVKKIIPYFKEEYKSLSKTTYIFNPGIKKEWVTEEGWALLKRNGWIEFALILSIPMTWVLISTIW